SIFHDDDKDETVLASPLSPYFFFPTDLWTGFTAHKKKSKKANEHKAFFLVPPLPDHNPSRSASSWLCNCLSLNRHKTTFIHRTPLCLRDGGGRNR
ncbi:631_t:CDS:2, partial [Acaulospora morrowiae]